MLEGSLLTDELKKLIGISTEPTVWKVEQGAIFRYVEAIGDTNPLFNDAEYAQNSRYGHITCPPGFTGWALKGKLRITEIFDKLQKAGAPPRILDGGIEYEFFSPIGEGDVLVSTSKIADIVDKGGKMLITTVETAYFNQNGDLVLLSKQPIINR